MTPQELKTLLISKGVKEEDIEYDTSLKRFYIHLNDIVHIQINEDHYDWYDVNFYVLDYNEDICYNSVTIENDLNFDRLMHFYKAFTGK